MGRLCQGAVPYRTVPYRRIRTAPLRIFARLHKHKDKRNHTGTRAHNHTQAHGHVGAHTQSQRGTGAINTRHWPPAGAGASPNVQLTHWSTGPLVDGSTLPCGPALALGPVACGLQAVGNQSLHHLTPNIHPLTITRHYRTKHHPTSTVVQSTIPPPLPFKVPPSSYPLIPPSSIHDPAMIHP